MKLGIAAGITIALALTGVSFAETADELIKSAKAKHQNGDYDGAIADYNKLVELDPKVAISYFRRSSARICKGDLAGTEADLSKAIELDGKYTQAWLARGSVRYQQQSWKDALSDFRKVMELDPADEYTRLRIWRTRTRMSETVEATKELKEHVATRKPGNRPYDWPGKICAFIAGQTAEEDFLKSASGGNRHSRIRQAIESYYFVGIKRVADGDKTGAKDFFEKALAEIKHADADRYDSSTVELNWINGEK